MKDKFIDTDLREALRRKYSDSPQLPADFMEKMQERMAQQNELSMPMPATKKRLWRWVAAAACILILIGVGVTMLPKEQPERGKDIFTQTNNPKKTDKKIAPEEQQVCYETTNEKQETPQHPLTSAKAHTHVVAEAHISSETDTSTETSSTAETSSSTETPAAYYPAQDANLYYASQSLTEDTAYQAPSRMDEFITKIAEYNKVKAVPLECASDSGDKAITNTAYVFQDTKELDLFGRLLQAACSYDTNTPGYLLNFSHQQFFFTLKDLRKDEKYLWIAERINGGRILLFTTHSPIEANVSSVCYQNYREQLTHIQLSSLQF